MGCLGLLSSEEMEARDSEEMLAGRSLFIECKRLRMGTLFTAWKK